MKERHFKFTIVSVHGKISNLSIIFLSVLIILFETPVLSRNCSNLIIYGMIAIFFIVNVNMLFVLNSQKKNALLLVILYLFYISVYKVLQISTAALSYYSTTVKFLFFFVAYVLIYDSLSKTQKLYLLVVIIAIIMIVLADNVRLFFKYGTQKYVSLFKTERFTSNGVNTPFVSALLLMAGAMFVVFLNEKNLRIKFISFAIVILLCIYSVAVAQRAIILLLSMVMYPLIILKNFNRARDRAILFILGLFLIIFFVLNYKSLLLIIAKIINSERISARMEQLIDVFSAGSKSSDGSAMKRIEYTLNSVKSFLSSPITFLFGVGDHRSSYEIIGNHCQFIDEFGRYGILGGTLVFYMIRSWFRLIKCCGNIRSHHIIYNQLKVLLLMYVLRGFLGSVFDQSLGIQLFFFVPIALDLLAENCPSEEGRKKDRRNNDEKSDKYTELNQNGGA